MYFSTYSPEELAPLPRLEALRLIGCLEDSVILYAPPCKRCNAPVIIVELGDSKYLQCSECGETFHFYSYRDTFFKRYLNGEKDSNV